MISSARSYDLKRVFGYIATVWFLFVVGSYFFYRFGKDGVLIALLCVIGGAAVWGIVRCFYRPRLRAPLVVRLSVLQGITAAWSFAMLLAMFFITIVYVEPSVSLVAAYGAIVVNVSILFLVYGILIVSYDLLGNAILHLMRMTTDPGIVRHVYCIAVGFCFSIVFFYLCALFGVLNQNMLFIYLVCALVVGWRDLREWWLSRNIRCITIRLTNFRDPATMRTWFVIALGVFLVAFMIGQFGFHPMSTDDLRTYYLVPKTFVQQQSIVDFPFDVFNNGAMGFAYGYAPFLLFGDQYLTVINVLAFVLLLGAVYALGLRLFDHEVAVMALFFVSATPLTIQLLYTAKPDLWMTALVLVATTMLFEEKFSAAKALCAGVLMGVAVAIKYNALFFVPPVLVGAVAWQYKQTHSLKFIIQYGCVAALGLAAGYAPWGIRLAWLWHNPLYPFLASGASASHQTILLPAAESAFHDFYETILDKAWVLSGVLPWWKNIWYLATNKSSYGGNLIGPLFFGSIGYLFIAARRLNSEQRIRLLFLGSIGMLSGILWFFVSVSQVWYALPALTLWCTVLGVTCVYSPSGWVRPLLVSAVILMILISVNGMQLSGARFLANRVTLAEYRSPFRYGFGVSEYLNTTLRAARPDYVVLPMGLGRAPLITDSYKHLYTGNFFLNEWVAIALGTNTNEEARQRLQALYITHIFVIDRDMAAYRRNWCIGRGISKDCALFDAIVQRLSDLTRTLRVVTSTDEWRLYEL